MANHVHCLASSLRVFCVKCFKNANPFIIHLTAYVMVFLSLVSEIQISLRDIGLMFVDLCSAERPQTNASAHTLTRDPLNQVLAYLHPLLTFYE